MFLNSTSPTLSNTGLVAIVCSKWMGDAFGAYGLYPQLIQLHGLPYIDAHNDFELYENAADIMTKRPVTLSCYAETYSSIKRILATHPFHGFPIVDTNESKLIHGFIARSDLEEEIEKYEQGLIDERREVEINDEKVDTKRRINMNMPIHFGIDGAKVSLPISSSNSSSSFFPLDRSRFGHFLDFSRCVDVDPICVNPSMPIERLMRLFQTLGVRYVLIKTPNGKLIGLVKKKDVLHYLTQTERHRRPSVVEELE